MSDLTTLLMDIARSVDPCSEDDERLLAEEAVKRFKVAELRELATRELEGWIHHYRREKARQIEREAERARQAEHARSAERRVSEGYEELFANPKGAYVRDGQGVVHDGCVGNARQRAAFQRWAGDRFEEWYDRAAREIKTHGTAENLEFFESDWYPDGPEAYYREKRLIATAKLIGQVAQETRLQVTQELLATYFALGDGSTVTWGEATIAHHEQRIAMLTANAAGVVEAAARHEAAVHMIKDAGVATLADLSPEAARRVAA